jgi:hypothetical protein
MYLITPTEHKSHILDEPTDRTLIDAKWESFALAPVLDPTAPDDYFLITMVR